MMIPQSPNNLPNSGSFMAPAGGGGTNVLQGMNTGMPAPMQVGNGSIPPMPQSPQVPVGSPAALPPMPMNQQPQAPMIPHPPLQVQPPGHNTPEAAGIIKALVDRLNTFNEIAKAQHSIHPSQTGRGS